MPDTSENLRFLLWEKEIDRTRWSQQLAVWVACTPERAEALLHGQTLTSSEQETLANKLGISEEDLQFRSLVEERGIDILYENIRFLLDSLKHGQQKEMAERIGVSPTTVSRWVSLQSTQRPQPAKREALRNYFGLATWIDLEKTPLFLALLPIGAKQQKEWLYDHIEQLKPDTLAQLFPALERLLRNP